MHCEHCDQEHPQGTRFCPMTGKRVAQVCPSCGESVDPGWEFCSHCGEPLSQTARATIAPAAESLPEPAPADEKSLPEPDAQNKELISAIVLPQEVHLPDPVLTREDPQPEDTTPLEEPVPDCASPVEELLPEPVPPTIVVPPEPAPPDEELLPEIAFPTEATPLEPLNPHEELLPELTSQSEDHVLAQIIPVEETLAEPAPQVEKPLPEPETPTEVTPPDPVPPVEELLPEPEPPVKILLPEPASQVEEMLTIPVPPVEEPHSGPIRPSGQALPEAPIVIIEPRAESAFPAKTLRRPLQLALALLASLSFLAAVIIFANRIGSAGIQSIMPLSFSNSGSVVFVSDRSGNREIYVMNDDGSHVTRLTYTDSDNRQPAWSPDGKKIVFVSDRDNGDQFIYIMNPDGSGQTRLTSQGFYDSFPSWSPDGSKIAFMSLRERNSDIFLMDPDGSNQTRVTTGLVSDDRIPWSPDGKKLLAISNRDGNQEIYMVNVDGSGDTRLTNSSGDEYGPIWSLDGKRIYFGQNVNGKFTSFVMNIDGSGRSEVNGSATVLDRFPSGMKVAYYSKTDGNEEVYVVYPNGSGKLRLTNNTFKDQDPDWTPHPLADAILNAPPGQPTPTITHTFSQISELEKAGKIGVYVNGVSIDSLVISVNNFTDKPLEVVVPAGTFFVSLMSEVQNMVVRHPASAPIPAGGSIEMTLDAACANLLRDEPSSSNPFTIQASPQPAELEKVIAAINTKSLTFAVEQAAIWIVTDNANYDALGMLVGGSRTGTELIEANEAARAMMLVDHSGLDISKYAIWADRGTFASGVTDPELTTWMNSRDPTAANPAPQAAVPAPPVETPEQNAEPVSTANTFYGKISQYAVKANASSEYDNSGWSAMQAAGVPNTTSCGDQKTAWASKKPDGKDWLLLNYDRPVIPTRIVVYQTFNPGAIALVEVFADDGKYYPVYKGNPAASLQCPATLIVNIKDLNVPARMVRITLDQTTTRAGWNEIDAVQLDGYPK